MSLPTTVLRGRKPQVEVQMQLVTEWLRPCFMPLNHNGPCKCKGEIDPVSLWEKYISGEAPTQNTAHITQNSNQPTMELLYTKGHLTLQVASAYAASHPLPLKCNKRLTALDFLLRTQSQSMCVGREGAPSSALPGEH